MVLVGGALALLVLSGCRQANPEWLGPGGGGTSGSTDASETVDEGAGGSIDGTGSDSADGTSTVGESSDDASPEVCMPPSIPGAGDCPAECDACAGGRCEISCNETDCSDRTIRCPEGWPCDVTCVGKDACKTTTIVCSDRDCTVDCSGESACEDGRIECGSMSCTVDCGPQPDACDTLDVRCGAADTRVTCAGNYGIDLDAGEGSCACEGIDC